MMRANTNRFVAQAQGASTSGATCTLMPMLPKRVLLILDTVDELYDEVAALKKELGRDA